MGVVHNEKCRKYKQQVENLKLDLELLQEKYDKLLQEKMNLKKRFDKIKKI